MPNRQLYTEEEQTLYSRRTFVIPAGVRMKCKTLVVVSYIWAPRLELMTNFASLHMTFSCFQHVKSWCENPIVRGRVTNKRNYICRNAMNNCFISSLKDGSN